MVQSGHSKARIRSRRKGIKINDVWTQNLGARLRTLACGGDSPPLAVRVAGSASSWNSCNLR